MLLGKRPRPPMKRTTSLSEITLDPNTTTDVPPLDSNNPFNRQRGGGGGPLKIPAGFSNGSDQRASAGATVSSSNHRRHSVDFNHTSDFLRSCSLCKRPLAPARDIYMYRGDSAFCSLECRQQAMNQDERKEKGSWKSKKKVVAPSAGSHVPTNGETVAAL